MDRLTPIQIAEIEAWTRANLRARIEYAAAPIASSRKPMAWVECRGGCGLEVLALASEGTGACKRCAQAEYRARKKAT